MAKFNVTLKDAVVPSGQKGYLSKWAGKTLRDNLEFHLDPEGEFEVSMLRDAGFAYVAEKLEAKGYAFSWKTSKVSKHMMGLRNASKPEVQEVFAEPVMQVAGQPTLEEQMKAIQEAIVLRDMEEALEINAKMNQPVQGASMPSKTVVQRMKRAELIALVESMR